MNRDDYRLLDTGMRILIGPELKGGEIYGGDDPPELKKWLNQEVTVRKVTLYDTTPSVSIMEEADVEFYMEEIECIIDETPIDESDEPLSVLLGGTGVTLHE